MTMATSTTNSATTLPTRRRRWWVPIVAIAIPVVMFFAVRICFAYELIPEAQMPLATAFFFSVPLALLILAVWWLFLSGFGWATKLIVVLIAVGLPFGF